MPKQTPNPRKVFGTPESGHTVRLGSKLDETAREAWDKGFPYMVFNGWVFHTGPTPAGFTWDDLYADTEAT